MKTLKTLAMIFAAMAIVCSSADANSVGLNGTIAGLRILSGSPVFYPEADVDGNGKVEMKDVILSLQIVAGLRGGFPDIVLAVADSMSSIKLAWLPVGVKYDVYLSETDNFDPSAIDPKKTVSTNQADIDGLDTGKTYYALIVSSDSAGNRIRSRQTVSVATLSEPVIISTTQKYGDAAELGLANPQINETSGEYTYPKATDSKPPEVGSILMSADGLKKVTSVNATADSIIVGTEDAELAQVLHQGSLSNTLVMFEDSDNPTLSTRDSDGIATKTMRWDDDLLVAEQKDFSETEKEKRDGESAGVDVTFKFQPKLKTDIGWKGDWYELVKLTKCRIVAEGTFGADINAWYKFAASGSFSKEKPIWSRKYRTKYMIGSVPVYQEITLSATAVFSASAYTQINANANANATTFVSFGIEYNPVTGAWDKIFSSGFEKSLTVNMSVVGGVHGEVRLIPKIEVKFYKAAAASLTLEPFMYGDIEAQAIAYADILSGYGYAGMQPTKCDFGLKAESYVEAKLKLIKKTFSLLDKTLIWESDPWLLFTLPTLMPPPDGSIATVHKSISLTASVENGVNNPFNDSTIRWYVYPANKGTVSGSGRTATFTPTEKGAYTIFFSGENRLGSLGRQFVKTVVLATPYDGPPMHGVPYRYHGIPDRCPGRQSDGCDAIDSSHMACIRFSSFDNAYYLKTSFKDVDGIIREDGGPFGQWYSDSCKPYKTGIFGNYVNGKMNGKLIQFFPYNYDLEATAYEMTTVVNGSPNGEWGKWDIEDGRPYEYGNRVNGLLDGTRTEIYYDSNNELKSYLKSTYKNGTLHGPKGEWLPDGTPKPDTWHLNYADGKLNGVSTYYCNNGKTITVTFLNGVEQSRSGDCGY